MAHHTKKEMKLMLDGDAHHELCTSIRQHIKECEDCQTLYRKAEKEWCEENPADEWPVEHP